MFQLTAPLREPTALNALCAELDAVSTHGSLAGADIIEDPETLIGDVSTHGSLAGADVII